MNENLKSSSVHVFVTFVKGIYICHNLLFCVTIQSIPFMNMLFTHGILGYRFINTKSTPKSPETLDLWYRVHHSFFGVVIVLFLNTQQQMFWYEFWYSILNSHNHIPNFQFVSGNVFEPLQSLRALVDHF